MTFSFRPAVRENVSLLIAVAGASGSGKTYSALKLATGLAGASGRVAFVDTEAGRAKHYADQFRFDHGDMTPPFSPDRYREAIEAADSAGYQVIVIDSMSHEWEGDGGLQDMQAAAVADAVEKARANHNPNWGAFDPVKAAERAGVGAWKEPKRQHKRMVSRLLQCRAHLIFCLRADEKIRIEKDEKGRTKIVQPADMPLTERWVPITEKRFMYEMATSLILTPAAPGVPVPVKIQDQHRFAFPDGQPITEETGRRLAEWARGGAVEAHGLATPVANAEAYAAYVADVLASPDETAASLVAWWNSDQQKAERRALGAAATAPVRDRVQARIRALEAAGHGVGA